MNFFTTTISKVNSFIVDNDMFIVSLFIMNSSSNSFAEGEWDMISKIFVTGCQFFTILPIYRLAKLLHEEDCTTFQQNYQLPLIYHVMGIYGFAWYYY